MTRLGSPAELVAARDELATAVQGKKRVLVCSTGCLAIGARDIEAAFREAAEQYAAFGVNAHDAVDKAADVPISLHCWQADDVAGLEVRDEAVEGGGIMATGNYPGRARNGDELRADLKQAIDLSA